MSSSRLPASGGGGMNTFFPKYITLYVLIAGIGGGLVFVGFILYCCRLCMGRRLPFGIIVSRANPKDSEAGIGTGVGAGSATNIRDHGTNGTTNTNTNTNPSKTGATTNSNTNGNGSGVDKKSCVVQYSSGSTQIVMTGGLQRKHSDEKQGFLSRSPRDSDGFKTCSTSGGRPDDNHYKSTIITPPHSPHYLTSTVISIEPSHRNVSPSSSSSSSSVQLDHHSGQNSELPSPRSPKSRHNSGGSSLSRCGSRGSARENRASMKTAPNNSRNTIRPRPVGGSLKDSRPNRRVRGGDFLTINPDVSPRRSVSLRSPRHPQCRSPQSKDGNLLPLYVGSENSVCMARDRNDNSYLKFNPSPTMSTHSLGQWTPLEQGLEWWKRKHKLQLVQHENPNQVEGGVSTKVRYNDIGSMEDIRGNEFGDFLFADNNEETETPISEIQPHQIKHQYRALWELRATLEEEDWKSAKNPPKILGMPAGPTLSPTILPKEDQQALLASSPDRDPLSSHTTSFESNTETIPDIAGHNKDNVFHQLGPTSHASLASRRQSYKNVLQNRMKRLERTASINNANVNAGNMTETTTSFDSIETQESTSTDTNTSRLEAMTTSMESTDNTDSTGESHHHHHPSVHSHSHSHPHPQPHPHVQANPHSHPHPHPQPHHSHHNHNHNNTSPNQYGQKSPFRCDSGYKSLENGPSPNSCNSNGSGGSGLVNNPTVHLFPRRCLSSSSAADTSSSSGSKQPLLGSSSSSRGGINRNDDIFSSTSSSSNVFFAKVGHQGQGQGQGPFQLPPPPSRNVSRKRRDFGRFERHSIGSLDSVREPLDEESCGSGDSASGRGGARGSLFYKYFRNPRSNSAYYTRDYSIDEKSDQLFREFSRCDPQIDSFTTATKNPATSPRSANGKMYARRSSSAREPCEFSSSSARGATSFDFPSTSSNLVNLGSGPYSTNKPLSRRASQHNVEDDFSESSRLLPSTRFHNTGGHPSSSIPIITVDDS